MDNADFLTVRELTERNERLILGKHACFSDGSQGRAVFEEKCGIRTEFQRDRDRIIHSSAFRRLKHKTQVYIAPESDHYRTRLTHTLEVAQIARTVARALRLNEDLTEAIALGHDLGHTPFGHAGERALNDVLPGGFRHYEQSLRVVDKLEKQGRGLNLTYEVRNGILCHTNGVADTLEGRVIKICDRVAYMNHDIDDSIKAGILSESDIPQNIREVLGNSKSKRIDTMVFAILSASSDDIRMSEPCKSAFDELHKFMFRSVYTNSAAKGEEHKADELVKTLYKYYVKNTDKLPPEYRAIAEDEGAQRAAADYVASMSDRYALIKFNDLFIPKSWMVF